MAIQPPKKSNDMVSFRNRGLYMNGLGFHKAGTNLKLKKRCFGMYGPKIIFLLLQRLPQ